MNNYSALFVYWSTIPVIYLKLYSKEYAIYFKLKKQLEICILRTNQLWLVKHSWHFCRPNPAVMIEEISQKNRQYLRVWNYRFLQSLS